MIPLTNISNVVHVDSEADMLYKTITYMCSLTPSPSLTDPTPNLTATLIPPPKPKPGTNQNAKNQPASQSFPRP